MSYQKATTAAAGETSTVISVQSAAPMTKHGHQVLQNFLLVWLDASCNKSDENFKKSIQNLRHIVTTIETFTDVQECVNFLRKVKEEKTFLVVSGSLAQQIILDIQSWPQLDSVYVFCDNQSIHEQWVKTIPKIRGVYKEIEMIEDALKIDCQRCERAMMPISFKGIDPLFMYTQLLKEVFLEIEYDNEKSIKELVDYCRDQDNPNEKEIIEVEGKYDSRKAIWWYTCESFMYGMLNRGLRVMEVDILLKMSFFIKDLHRHIETLYREQKSTSSKTTTTFRVFRGQGLPQEAFEKLKMTKETKGGLMSFNNFLSTSFNRDISLKFALPELHDPSKVAVLFFMTIDPKVCETSKIPFADVKEVGYFQGDEEEVLFSTHTIFRIDCIKKVEDYPADRLWQVDLTLVGNDDHDLVGLTKHMRKELIAKTVRGWSRLGFILIKIGQSSKAEQLYQTLLKQASSDKDRIDYNILLGSAYDDMGEYLKALSYYQQALKIQKVVLPPNHPDLALSYSNIGSVYANMKKYTEALSNYEVDLKISQMALNAIHPNLAISYHNIGNVYAIMGKYSEALSWYKEGLDIDKQVLPPNHPNLAICYMNMGAVYDRMGDYSKALSFHEEAMTIQQKALPPDHPDLALSYNNVGVVYFNTGEYQKALSYYEKALKINEKTLSSTHPNLVASTRYIEMAKTMLK